jgi:hypothetical protein
MTNTSRAILWGIYLQFSTPAGTRGQITIGDKEEKKRREKKEKYSVLVSSSSRSS